jgi:hypothetical protein
MKETEQQPRHRCPGCGERLLWGAIFAAIATADDEKMQKVYGLHTTNLNNCDAIYMGCVIEKGLTCPTCGATVSDTVEVEVEYSDKCELCGNPPEGFLWYWDPTRRCRIGLCKTCRDSEAGERWERAR